MRLRLQPSTSAAFELIALDEDDAPRLNGPCCGDELLCKEQTVTFSFLESYTFEGLYQFTTDGFHFIDHHKPISLLSIAGSPSLCDLSSGLKHGSAISFNIVEKYTDRSETWCFVAFV